MPTRLRMKSKPPATESVADLARALELPVLVVARRSLGTLNHTLLTLEAARGRNLPVVGVIVALVFKPVEQQRQVLVHLLALVDVAPDIGEVRLHLRIGKLRKRPLPQHTLRGLQPQIG